MFRQKIALQSIPDQDIYFFVTPSVHNFDFERDTADLPIDMYDNRRRIFPSESLAYIKLEAIYPLNDNLTKKGALGNMSGIELGGIELIITLLDKYAQSQNSWIPRMCGLYTRHVRRDNKFYFTEWPPARQIEDYFDPTETTPRAVKDARRKATITAALEALNLSSADYNNLFANTVLVDASEFMFANDET